MIDGEPEETGRRTELIRYACQLLAPPAPANDHRSMLGEIERRSQELLEKGRATVFVDKGGDSEEVARLVDQFRETITHYQVSGNVSVRPGAILTTR